MPPRSAYIHVPFCAHRCGYCNFTLVAGRDDLIEPYLDALEKELRQLDMPREVDTLFFGGGTPTRLNGEQLRRMLRLVLEWYPLAELNEFSIEANPIDIDAEMVAILAEHGVTRVSLGSQSFNAAKLKLLERDHSGDDILRAVELLRTPHFSIALDLIFGVPGETEEIWRNDLHSALSLRPDHVSTYGLTFERGTQFWNRLQHDELARVDEELERRLYEHSIDTLTGASFEHYEVSNFALAGHRCRHNEAYWLGAEYYAAGPGAARYIDGVRSINHRSTTTYIKRLMSGTSPESAPQIAESERLSTEDRARELLVFAMRRLEGVSRRWFAERSGCELDTLVGTALPRMIELRLLADDGERVRLTRAGLLVSDSIWSKML